MLWCRMCIRLFWRLLVFVHLFIESSQKRSCLDLYIKIQALALTHTGASEAELEPYLSTRLAPLQPVVLFGRNAKRVPECHPQECVYYAWRDRAWVNEFYVSRCEGLCLHLSDDFFACQWALGCERMRVCVPEVYLIPSFFHGPCS